MSYDNSFYDVINQGSIRSAQVVLPMVLSLFAEAGHPVQRVLDVGCGQGAWSKVFGDLGCAVTGLDGSYVDQTRLLIPQESFIPTDLNREFSVAGDYDLAISLEVAEHLKPTRAEGFVADLCESADAILFSAAIPGQGGTGHINEQWPDYWAEKFEANGFAVTGALRWSIWNDPDVENWYRQNLLLCVKSPLEAAFPAFSHPVSDPIPVVHPVLWDHVRPS